jgi:hypothetical protein
VSKGVGTFTAGAGTVASAKGVSLNLTNDTAYFATPSTSDLKPTLPASMSFWLFLRQNAVYFTNDDWADTYDSYSGLMVFVATNNLQAHYGMVGSPSPAARRTKSANLTITTNTWHLICAVWRGPTDMTLWLDGVDVGGTYSGTGGPLAYDGRIGRVGYASSRAGSNPKPRCLVDDYRIWSRALTAADVKSMYYIRRPTQ